MDLMLVLLRAAAVGSLALVWLHSAAMDCLIAASWVWLREQWWYKVRIDLSHEYINHFSQLSCFESIHVPIYASFVMWVSYAAALAKEEI